MAAPTDGQLSQPAIRLALCMYLDIAGDPLRHCLAPVQWLHMPGASILPVPDANFDNKDFTALDPRVLTVSPVKHASGGTESVQLTLSGTLELDADSLTALSDPARFQGRVIQMWQVLLGDDYEPIAARPFYTGYMSAVTVTAEPPDDAGHARQTITLESENYLTIIGGSAPARTLLWSPDPDDHAAEATTGSAGASSALSDNIWLRAAQAAVQANK